MKACDNNGNYAWRHLVEIFVSPIHTNVAFLMRNLWYKIF